MTTRRNVYSRPGTANPLGIPPPFSSTPRLDTAYAKDNHPRPSFSGSLRPDPADPRRPSTGIASAVHNAMSRIKDETRLKRTFGGLGDTVEKVARKIGLSRPIRDDTSPKGLLASTAEKRSSTILSEPSSVGRPYRSKSKRGLRWRGNSYSSTQTSLVTLDQGQVAPTNPLRHDSYGNEQERRQRNRHSFCVQDNVWVPMAMPPLPNAPGHVGGNGQPGQDSNRLEDRPPEVRRCNSLAHNMRLGGGASGGAASGMAAARHNSLRGGYGTRQLHSNNPSTGSIQRVPILQFHQFPASAGASARAAVAEHNRTFFLAGFSEESIPEQDTADENQNHAEISSQPAVQSDLQSTALIPASSCDMSTAPPTSVAVSSPVAITDVPTTIKSSGSPYDSADLDTDSDHSATLEMDRKSRKASYNSLDSMADSVMDVDPQSDVSFLGKSHVFICMSRSQAIRSRSIAANRARGDCFLQP